MQHYVLTESRSEFFAMSMQMPSMPSDVELPSISSAELDENSVVKIDIVWVNDLDDSTKHEIDVLAFEHRTGHLKNAFFAREPISASAAFSRKTVYWLLYHRGNSLAFAAPVVKLGMSGFNCLKIQTHNYAPLGAPLMTSDFDAAGFRQQLAAMGYAALLCPILERNSKFAQNMQSTSDVFWSSMLSRAWLQSSWDEEQVLSTKRRKELRRLAKKVPLDHVVLEGEDARTEGFKEFCRLEALGWKGDFGTALKQEEHVFAYARALVDHHAAAGTLTIDCLRDGARTVAMLITFQQGGRGVIWKIAHDPEFDHVSPGRQLILAATARFISQNEIVSMDSLADENHPLINRLWPERLDLGTMAVVLGQFSLPARILSGLDELESRLRAKARVLRKRLRG